MILFIKFDYSHRLNNDFKIKYKYIDFWSLISKGISFRYRREYGEYLSKCILERLAACDRDRYLNALDEDLSRLSSSKKRLLTEHSKDASILKCLSKDPEQRISLMAKQSFETLNLENV